MNYMLVHARQFLPRAAKTNKAFTLISCAILILLSPILIWAPVQAASTDKSQSEALNVPSKLTPYSLTNEQIAILDTEQPVLDVWAGQDDSRIVEVFGTIDVNADPEQIWAIMKNCDLQIQIIENMTRCEITHVDPSARWDERLQVLSIGRLLPKVRSRFRTEYTPYREIKISRLGGDLSVLDGLWSLQLTQDGQTRVSYRARLKPKLPVPRGIMRRATAKDMPIILKNLRDLAQKNQTRAQAAPIGPINTDQSPGPSAQPSTGPNTPATPISGTSLPNTPRYDAAAEP